jgi:prepilin-type N-terminal cleavage/methylation domain-containing protein
MRQKGFTPLNPNGSRQRAGNLTGLPLVAPQGAKWGFTLIELLVVIAIIAIVASLATIGLTSMRAKGRDTKRVGDVRQVQMALEIYKNDNGVYPSAITAGNAMVGPNSVTYMAKVPAPPGKNDGSCTSDTYTYSSASPYSVYSIAYCLGQAVQTAGPADCIARPGNICSPPIVGENYGGGVVAYIFVNGDTGYIIGQTHGLIVASSDQSYGGTAWITGGSTQTTANGSALTALGRGQLNTTAMINQSGYTGGAAQVCDDYTTSGYSDWYLPSKDELWKVFLNKASISAGFFDFGLYWTSSEWNATNALFQRFWTTGWQGQAAKSENTGNYGYVHCMRSF